MDKEEKKPKSKEKLDAMKRILSVLREKNITDSDFYHQLGLEYPTQTWNNWNNRGLPPKEVPRCAGLLNLHHEWISKGTGSKYKTEVATPQPEKPPGQGLSNRETEQVQADELLSKTQAKTLNDLRQLLAQDIEPMDLVTLQQIIGMLTNKYQNKKD